MLTRTRKENRNGARTPRTQRALGLAVAIVAATSWFVVTAPVSAQTSTDERQLHNVSEFRGQGFKKVYMTLTMSNVPDQSDTFAFTVSCMDVAPRTLSWPDDIYFGNIFNDGETYYVMTAPDVADAECSMAINAPAGWECRHDTFRRLAKLTFHAGCSNPANDPSVTTAPAPWPTEDTVGDTTTVTSPPPQTTTTIPRPRTTPETIEW